MSQSGVDCFLILGTAGHIDHGKTSLVRVLTGTQTDRLPEERQRGISIDLGFAEWRLGNTTLGIVDVPGHERFVRNMVAGATGIDLAMLVVAADDGIMPQTREHLDIMDLLGIRAGLIVLTKTDLVDEDWCELIKLELEEFCRGTFLEQAPILACSTVTGAGLDELRHALQRAIAGLEQRRAGELFRMPIDRVFSVPGQGCVVTGTAIRGSVIVGDRLELWPSGTEVRVRGIQTHGQDVAGSFSGRRTALNLAGVKASSLKRGDELASPGALRPSRRLLVHVRTPAGNKADVRDRVTLRLHLGTLEVGARLLLRGETLAAGESCFAELRLDSPVVAEHGQHFILRQSSPAMTVAGGEILDPCIEVGQRIRNLAEAGRLWASRDPLIRLGHWASFQDEVFPSLEIALRTGIPLDQQEIAFQQLLEQGELIPTGNSRHVGRIHRRRLGVLLEAALRLIRAAILRQHPRRAVSIQSLREACQSLAAPHIVETIFAELKRQQKLVEVGDKLGLAEMQVRLTRQQSEWQARMVEAIRAGGLMPPLLPEWAKQLGADEELLRLLLQLKADEDVLIQIDETYFLAPPPLRRARLMCRELFRNQASATVAQLRDAWGVSRRFAFPLCEYFDQQQWTVRDGDVHFPGTLLEANL